MRFRDGSEHTLTFFVSRLEYSRWTIASFVPDQSVETCVRTLIAHYRVMGGVPLLAAFDRARPIGIGADRDGRVSEWDPAFAYAALQIGLGIEVRARRGADRGPGTNLGNWLKLAFFKGVSFTDEADAARQLADWLREQNNQPQAEASGKTSALLLTEERQRLRPLRVEPRDFALRFPVLVGPRALVVHDGQSYSMPPDSVGLVGALHLYPDRIAIVAGRYEAAHQRRQPVLVGLPSAATASSGGWAPSPAIPLAARAG